jgi:hypothetical protein
MAPDNLRRRRAGAGLQLKTSNFSTSCLTPTPPNTASEPLRPRSAGGRSRRRVNTASPQLLMIAVALIAQSRRRKLVQSEIFTNWHSTEAVLQGTKAMDDRRPQPSCTTITSNYYLPNECCFTNFGYRNSLCRHGRRCILLRTVTNLSFCILRRLLSSS